MLMRWAAEDGPLGMLFCCLDVCAAWRAGKSKGDWRACLAPVIGVGWAGDARRESRSKLR